MLHVDVIAGRELAAKDKNVFKPDSSDPYVIIKVRCCMGWPYCG